MRLILWRAILLSIHLFNVVVSSDQIFPAHTGGSFSRSSREPNYGIEFHSPDLPFHPDDDQESVIMPGKDGQKFICFLPKVEKSKSEKPISQQNTSSVIVGTEKRLKPKTPDELLEVLKDRCFIRQEGWWSYEFCYQKKLRQIHLEDDKVVQEFVLGVYDDEATAAYNQNLSDISTLKDPRSKDASQRYHAHQYTNGTMCDLTNQPRETEPPISIPRPRQSTTIYCFFFNGLMAGNSEDYDPSKDPTRKAKSADPSWKYGFWPDLNNKGVVQCILCNKKMHSGVRRLKQHLAGGYSDIARCTKTTPEIIQEMKDYISRRKKSSVLLDDDNADSDDDEIQIQKNESSTAGSNTLQSQGTTSKRKSQGLQFVVPQSKSSKTIASMIRKTPEEVIEDRHSKGPSQSSLESCTRSEEEKERVKMHIANFFYENGIPFNAAHSRSYEIMVESIGQFGPGLKPPSYHELRVPLLEKAKKETDKLKEKQEKAWKQYGCTLMSDGWTDKRGRHLINFLVNCPEGTFFLSSVDVSSKVQDAKMLADLFEEQINLIGRENVIQVVTDNGANFKAAGGILSRRIPTLYWTPCAAHCLDLMLEDICKLKEFEPTITNGRGLTTFIYRHGRLLAAMREKTQGRDIVRAGTTRFATAFLTLQSINKNQEALRNLFGSKDWFDSKLSKTAAGKKVHDVVLSTKFWNSVKDCLLASLPLLQVLRVVDGDEKPAMAELCAAMDYAKVKMKDGLENKQRLLNKVLKIVEKRWQSQMEVELYGAALFLNPGKFFDIKENDYAYSCQLRMKFNDVLEKLVVDASLVEKISNQADQYENSRNAFGKQLSIRQRKSKSPLDWWGAFGGLTLELAMFSKRIIGLCCSSSGCERNWSTFEFIHTKKRNRLEHQRLNDLVYIQYNRKIATRFQKRREEGRDYNPLILEDFQWDNEWVNGEVIDPAEEELWEAVDEALEASRNLEGRRSQRRAAASSSQADASSDIEIMEEREPIILNDDENVDDDYGYRSPNNNSQRNDEARAQDNILDLYDDV